MVVRNDVKFNRVAEKVKSRPVIAVGTALKEFKVLFRTDNDINFGHGNNIDINPQYHRFR